MKAKNVNREVTEIEQRVRSSEAVMRMILQVQLEQMAKAEKLRKLAMEVEHVSMVALPRRRLPDLNLLTTVSIAKLEALNEFAKTLKRFGYTEKQKAKARAFLRRKR